MADFLEEFVQQGMPLDDMIIGTLNTIDPLLILQGSVIRSVSDI